MNIFKELTGEDIVGFDIIYRYLARTLIHEQRNAVFLSKNKYNHYTLETTGDTIETSFLAEKKNQHGVCVEILRETQDKIGKKNKIKKIQLYGRSNITVMELYANDIFYCPCCQSYYSGSKWSEAKNEWVQERGSNGEGINEKFFNLNKKTIIEIYKRTKDRPHSLIRLCERHRKIVFKLRRRWPKKCVGRFYAEQIKSTRILSEKYPWNVEREYRPDWILDSIPLTSRYSTYEEIPEEYKYFDFKCGGVIAKKFQKNISKQKKYIERRLKKLLKRKIVLTKNEQLFFQMMLGATRITKIYEGIKC